MSPTAWLRRARDDRPPVHFLHIGKTGGTALTHALLQHAAASPYRIVLPGHFAPLSTVPPGEKVLFVVRNPLSRFVSAFNGRLRQARPRYDYPWRPEERRAFAIFKTPDSLATALSSADEVERLRAEQAMRAIGHLNTSYWYWFRDEQTLLSRVPDLLFIAFQERLDDDFQLLKRKLRLPEEARLPSDEILAHRTPPGFERHLGPVARANLARWYARDIRFVGLCRELARRVNRAGLEP